VRISAPLSAVFLAAFCVPAAAAEAYTTDVVNLRAGPGAGFPRVATLPAGHLVRVHGCLPEWEWCDLSFRGARGWVSGDYLEFLIAEDRLPPDEYGRRGDLPVIAFDLEVYWERWYADRPWYDEREIFIRRWEDTAGIGLGTGRARARSDGFATGSTAREALPPGIAKKGGGFCPPGQRKKGRC
jgi:uncharacterized protein YraI